MDYEKDFDGWFVLKKKINNQQQPFPVKEGGIYWCSLGINIGSEIDGKSIDFSRPVVIIKRINFRTAIAIPITSKPRLNDLNYYKISGYTESFAVISQIKHISTNRIIRFSREMDKSEFKELINLLVGLIKNENPE